MPAKSFIVTSTPIAVSLQYIQYKLSRVMSQQLKANSGKIDQFCRSFAA